MERRDFGKTGMNLSVLGFGGAEIGFEGASLETVRTLLRTALDAGLNVIDTAECYMNSEELIGEALEGRRNDYFLFTKCGHEKAPASADWSAASLNRSIDRSLTRLRTDRVDLIQLHSCSEEVLRRGEAVEVLQKAKQNGKTRFIGYSGDGSDAAFAVDSGAFDSLQTSVSIADQQALEHNIPAARERGMGVIAKRPIANAAWRYAGKPDNSYHVEYWERLQKLDYDFLRTPGAAETSIRWTLGIPGVDVAIVGTTKPDRWQGNADLVRKGPLDQEQQEAIRARYRAIADANWVGQV